MLATARACMSEGEYGSMAVASPPVGVDRAEELRSGSRYRC